MAHISSDVQGTHALSFFTEWSRAHLAAGFPADATVSVTPWPVKESTDSARDVAPDAAADSRVIPEGTLAWAMVKVRPFNLDQGLVLRPTKSTDGNAYLDVELTLLDCQYRGLSVFDTFAISGPECREGMAKVRHILEVGREIQGFAATDSKYRLGVSSGAQGDMVLMELNELRCAVKIGVEKGEGSYPDKSKVRAYLSPNPASDTFKTFMRLVNGDTGRVGKSAPKRVVRGPSAVRLDEPAEIADAYFAAVGEFHPGCVDFASQEDWDIAAGATVGIQRPDGTIETVWAAFDDADVAEGDGAAPIQWDEEAGRYVLVARDDGNHCEEHLAGEAEAGLVDVTRYTNDPLKAWTNRTRLLSRARAKVGNFDAQLEDNSVRRHILRCGFLPKPIADSCDRKATLKKIGLGVVGGIRLGHLATMASSKSAMPVLDDAFLIRAAAKWSLCGETFDTLMRMPGIATVNPHVTFVVPGYIPRGELTIVSGDAQAGKSTLFHDLAIIVGTKAGVREAQRAWLSVPVSEIAHGTAIVLSGEDGASILMDRREALCGGAAGGDADIIEIPLNGMDDPAELLENLLTVDNIALLVVDPARSFIKGNEDESANVDAALSTLVRFAAEKQCAVVVLHHLKKSARPASPHDAVEGLRGSGAFKARARVAIGIVRKGDVVSIGVAKHNMPPQYPMQTETKKFRRQAGAPRLVGLEDASVVKSSTSEDGALQDVARIVDAIRAARAREVPVMRSGRQGIFEVGLPELADMTRNGVRGATKRALEAGVVSLTPDGYLVRAEVSVEDVPAVAEPHLVNAATPSTPAENVGESMG